MARLAARACRGAIAWGLVLGCAVAARADEVPPQPLFSRHVVPVFSKLGCNAGLCHGAVKGQGGLRLSLFGAEPELDHGRLLREFGGRRLNPLEPDASLLLLKATGQVPHTGGVRTRVGSREYQIIRNWLASGARLDDVARSREVELTISPASQTVPLGESYSLAVRARYGDGSAEEVTALCTFESANKQVAEVDSAGRVQAIGVGDAAVIVRFRGQPAIAQLVVPNKPLDRFPDLPAASFIDRHIHDKLRRLNILPSEPCDDATFLRRASLDVTGALPTPDEIRAFLADTAADKRARKIDELLDRPGHAALWATKWCDILRPTGFDAKLGLNETAETRRFYDWLRARIADNLPYDQFAERILTATSREGRSEEAWVEEVKALMQENAAKTHELKAYAGRKTLDLYWQRANATGVKGTLQVAHAFLGLRLECAQCHRHPHDVWQQDDLLSFANFFMKVSAPGTSSPEAARMAERLAADLKTLKDDAKKLADRAKDKGLAKEEAERLKLEAEQAAARAKAIEDAAKRVKGAEVHVLAKASFASVTSTIGKQDSKQFRLLGSKQPVQVPPGADPRQVVVDWLRRPDNPFFARALVNRVWAHYFGRGIIDPPDQLSPLNPPTHPELLAELCQDFIRSGYDVKHLHRTILNSQTYQRSARTNPTSKHDVSNYASFYLQRLPAEVLVDAINHATAGSESYPPELLLPPGARAMEVAGGTGSDKARASLQYAFQIFGRPARNPEVQCDCERDTTPAITQALYLANHPAVRDKISRPDGRLAQIVKTFADDARRIEEVYLWTLSRLPSDEERQTCLAYLKESPSPERGLEDVMWSLLNTREFLLNH